MFLAVKNNQGKKVLYDLSDVHKIEEAEVGSNIYFKERDEEGCQWYDNISTPIDTIIERLTLINEIKLK